MDDNPQQQGGMLQPTTLVATGTNWEKPPEDHPIYAKIGRVASDWSHVEHVLDLLIWKLAGGEYPAVASIVGQMNGHYGRFDAVLALLTWRELLTDALRKKVRRIAGECGNTGQSRNRVVHDAWYVRSGLNTDPSPYRSMTRHDTRLGIVDIPDDYFNAILAEIEERYKEVTQLSEEIGQLLASRGTDQ